MCPQLAPGKTCTASMEAAHRPPGTEVYGKMSHDANARVWYRQGLRFQCQGCGACCRGPGGYVWITVPEAEAMAGALGQTFEEFAARMLRQTTSGLALVDDPSGNCPLLGEDGRCRVYRQRPTQCRTWPWWEENLISEKRWDAAASRCPGMNKGELHSRLVIDCEQAKDF